MQKLLRGTERQKGKYNSIEKDNHKEETMDTTKTPQIPTFQTINKWKPTNKNNLNTPRNNSTEKEPTNNTKIKTRQHDRSATESPDRFESITQILERARQRPEPPKSPREQVAGINKKRT